MGMNRSFSFMKRINFNNISIKYSFLIVLILIVTPMFFLMSTIYYSQIKQGIIENSEIAVAQSKETIINTIQITEKSYEFVSVNYDELMQNCLIEFNKEYEKNGQNVDEINIELLKKKFNNKMDLYVIDKNGVIVRSTFATALGIDFSTIPEFYEALTKIRLGNTIQISKVTTDLRTMELRKWGYIPTKDHEWILEVGISADEISKYIKNIDYVAMENKIKEINPYIKSIRLYDMHYVPLGYEESINNEKKAIIEKIMNSGMNETFRMSNGLIDTEYVFISTFSDALDDSKKVIEIQYDNALVIDHILQLRVSVMLLFLGYTLSSLVAMRLISNKYIVKPLLNLSLEISRFYKGYENMRVTVNGNNEIAEVAKTFNDVFDRLSDNMVSRKYLENVLDSVGDLIILLDNELNIKQINHYGRTILGHKDISNLHEVISNPECLTTIKERIKIEKNITDVEIIIKDSFGNNMFFLSTWAPLLNVNGNIEGYVCNAKNFTKTKEVIDKLKFMNSELSIKEQELIKKSNRDFLTGLFNKEYAVIKLNQLIEKNDSKSGFCILMMDIDHFKDVNDNYGHLVGDEVLIKVSEIISSNIRDKDIATRFGGEEFLIILPETDSTTGLMVAERIRECIERANFTDKSIKITISGGLSTWRGERLDDLIEQADRQLYLSKSNGRNQISYSI